MKSRKSMLEQLMDLKRTMDEHVQSTRVEVGEDHARDLVERYQHEAEVTAEMMKDGMESLVNVMRHYINLHDKHEEVICKLRTLTATLSGCEEECE